MLSVGRTSVNPSHTLRRQQQPSIRIIYYSNLGEATMRWTTIGSRNGNTAFRRPLSMCSIIESQKGWKCIRPVTYSRPSSLPNREYKLYGAHSMIQGTYFGTLSHSNQSARYEVNIRERNIHQYRWNVIHQPCFMGCIHVPHRSHPQRLTLSGMHLSYFSSVPSLKPNDEKSTATTSTVSTSTATAAATSTTSTTTHTTTDRRTTPLPSRKLGKTAVPTPPSAPPPDMNPLQSLKDATPKSVIRKGVDLIVSASKVVVTQLMKLPGNLFFYATHPSETKAAYIKLRDTVKHEIHHYWVGTKLLWADIVTARKLMNKTLEGSALTRRERKQLLRTVSDLFRLIPFSMFVIVPFMEFALPFALRLFPNMLPSTYQDSLKAEENMKRELKSRIAMAQFFQE